MGQKHVKSFSQFQRITESNEPVLIGSYSDGGMGSHPGILTASELSRYGFVKDGNTWMQKEDDLSVFFVNTVLQSTPEALACITTYGGDWDFKAISKSLAQKFTGMVGDDTIENFGGEAQEKMRQIEKMLGLPKTTYPAGGITIISNPRLNVVYWSDEPEQTGGIWMPPYRAMTLDELVSQRDLNF